MCMGVFKFCLSTTDMLSISRVHVPALREADWFALFKMHRWSDAVRLSKEEKKRRRCCSHRLQSEPLQYTGTKLINHVSVRKYTSLQLFVGTKRDGSWQIPLNIIHQNSLQCVQSQTQYTKLFFIINASAVTCTAWRKWKWSHCCHHVILYLTRRTTRRFVCLPVYILLCKHFEANLLVRLIGVHFIWQTTERNAISASAHTRSHSHAEERQRESWISHYWVQIRVVLNSPFCLRSPVYW